VVVVALGVGVGVAFAFAGVGRVKCPPSIFTLDCVLWPDDALRGGFEHYSLLSPAATGP